MKADTNLISAALRIVGRHKRYVFWFWLLNLILAEFGTAVFRNRLHSTLDHSLLADRLFHGFDLAVYLEMVSRPQWGPVGDASAVATLFAFSFFLLTLFCLPGVLEAYTSEGKLSREDFFGCCGRNVWRFVRVLVFYSVIAGAASSALYGSQAALVAAAEKTTNELLPFYASLAMTGLILLVLTFIRAWFDLAQVDVVVRDQGAVHKSIAAALQYIRQNAIRLLGAYGLIGLLGLLMMVGGLWLSYRFVPSSNVLGTFVIAQAILLLGLGMRFWQRAAAVTFYLEATAGPDLLVAVIEPVSAPALAPMDRSEGGGASE